jgi:sugar-specific transcriptional regulator TrmB
MQSSIVSLNLSKHFYMYEILLKIGLSEKEAKVYLATLELAEDTAQNIAKKSGVNRATTYVILEKLMTSGLVSSIERAKKTMFISESPQELINILELQKREIDAKKKYLDEAMTQLQAIYNAKGDKPIVRYFEGADGLEALDRYGHDQFKEGSEVLGITPIDIVEEQFPSRRKAAVNDRVKRRIKSRMIYTHKGGVIPGYVNEKELREGIYLPRDVFPIDITISIYPEWGVKFYNFDPKNHFGVLLQSPNIARNLKKVFELAWEGAKTRKDT